MISDPLSPILKRGKPSTGTTAWEHEIDKRVYRLYGLTLEEIQIVEESGK